MTNTPFKDIARIDARGKVSGATRYAADDARPELLHAAFAIAKVGPATIQSLDTAAAASMPGVRLILTHEKVGKLQAAGFLMGGGFAFQSHQPMLSPRVAYRGAPIALVIADRLEIAIEAAAAINGKYGAEPVSALMSSPGAQTISQQESPLPKPMFADTVAGDAPRTFEAAAVKVDATYTSPAQHQNPLELIATVAEWKGEQLIIHEGTQNAQALRHGVAKQLGIPPDQVQVISPWLGGGFGQKNSLQMQTALVALASRQLARPVKLVVPRTQVFHDASFRPASIHRIRLGAQSDGKLIAALHDVDAQTSRHDLFPARYTETSARLWGIDNFRGFQRLVRTDVQTPGYMRAPFEHAACFAMECAVDELAYRANKDPVALRLANDTATDPVTQLPLSSRHLAECLRLGAARFEWAKRSMAPMSMRAEDGTLVGWGVACGAYPANSGASIARLEVRDDGAVILSVGGHEMGQGIRTVATAVVARKLNVPVESVQCLIGDTRHAPQHLTAGSWGTSMIVTAADAASDAMIAALAQLPPAKPDAAPAQRLKRAKQPSLEVTVQTKAPGQPDAAIQRLNAGQLSVAGPNYSKFVSFSYIAHFVEVRVETTTRRVRIPRVVSVADCGRVVSPRTAASQVHGGVVWGIGAALREVSEVDPRFGGFLNSDIAEYVIPVNADIGTIDVQFIDKPDPLINAIGAKGLGEVAMTGVAPAIANAIFHATGKRVRDLPIRLEQLL